MFSFPGGTLRDWSKVAWKYSLAQLWRGGAYSFEVSLFFEFSLWISDDFEQVIFE